MHSDPTPARRRRVPWLRGTIALALTSVALCLLVFGATTTAAWLALGGVLWLWPWRRTRAATLAGWSLVAVLGFRVPLHEYSDRVEGLMATLERGGPSALTTRDRTGIWLLNLGMAAGGIAVGLPEVALETVLLAVPGPDERHFRSCFATRSPRVRAALDAQRAALPETGAPGQEVPLTERRVGFPVGSVPRVALALNPTTISGTASWDGARWQIDHELRVPVDYPTRFALPLFRFDGRALVIEEGLYDALERLGWLHPYTAVWHCAAGQS